MTHNRPYRHALPHAEAIRRIREGAATQLDPGVIEHFLAVVGDGGEAGA